MVRQLLQHLLDIFLRRLPGVDIAGVIGFQFFQSEVFLLLQGHIVIIDCGADNGGIIRQNVCPFFSGKLRELHLAQIHIDSVFLHHLRQICGVIGIIESRDIKAGCSGVIGNDAVQNRASHQVQVRIQDNLTAGGIDFESHGGILGHTGDHASHKSVVGGNICRQGHIRGELSAAEPVQVLFHLLHGLIHQGFLLIEKEFLGRGCAKASERQECASADGTHAQGSRGTDEKALSLLLRRLLHLAVVIIVHRRSVYRRLRRYILAVLLLRLRRHILAVLRLLRLRCRCRLHQLLTATGTELCVVINL